MRTNNFIMWVILVFVLAASVVALTQDRILVEEVDDIYKDDVITFMTSEGLLTLDKSTVTLNNVKAPIYVDELEYPNGEEDGALMGTEAFVHKPYYDQWGNVSLDVYIEDTFYYGNQAALDDFWNKFYPRFEIMKNLTGWSSKRWFGVPLEIYVYGHSAACYGGNASPTHSNVVFSDPMYKTGCHKPYFNYFNGTAVYNNPGQLGDWWPYMNTALHEAMHSIMPYPIYTRSWLTEGWAEYYMYNTLTEIVPGNTRPDINHETADTYLYRGFAGYQWDPYVKNDFHDTTVYNRELQRSHGYDIVGWLFSKLRDDDNMDWDLFYTLMNNNKDSLDRTFSLGPPYIYYTDAFVVNVFGKAMGHTDYMTQTDPMFNYYSTSEHGYGARNISGPYNTFSWMADYSSSLVLTNYNINPGDSVTATATVYNNGDVNGQNIIVRLYDNGNLIHTEALNINKFQNKQVQKTFTPSGTGAHNIEVRVDEFDMKVEKNDSNNDDFAILSVNLPPTPPVIYPVGDKEVMENNLLTFQVTATDANNDTLYFGIAAGPGSINSNSGVYTWTPDNNDAGVYDLSLLVYDGTFVVYENISVTVTNDPTPTTLNLIGNKVLTEGDVLNFQMTAYGGDGPFTYYTYFQKGSLNNGNYLWQPTPFDHGTYEAQFFVTDGFTTDSETITITVNDNGGPLDMDYFDPIEVGEMGTVYITPRVSYPNNDGLTFGINSQAFTWDETNQRFRWRTGPMDSGEYMFTVNVTEGSTSIDRLVSVTVNNRCTFFDKRNWCWVGCTCKDISVQQESAPNLY